MDGAQARILARIWDDPEWLALSIDAQWLYQSGLSQPEITQCGVLPLLESRWAQMAAYIDIDTVRAARKLLCDTRFWVVDESSGEVLYRSFLRTREVWRNPSHLKAACMAARHARGPVVRAALLAELQRLPQDHIRMLRANRTTQQRPWCVYVDTLALLRGDPPGGPDPDPDTGQMTFPGLGRPAHTASSALLQEPATPVDRPAVPDDDRTAAPASAFLLQALPQALPQGLGQHTKSKSSCSSVVEAGSCTSVVACVAHTRAPAREAPPPTAAPAVEVVDAEPEPEWPSPADVRAARYRRRRDGSLLGQPPVHPRAVGLVREQTADWPLPPTGRDLTRWRVEVSTLLHDAIPEAAIAAGMEACRAKGFNPTALASFVFGEANRRPTQTPTERNLDTLTDAYREDGGPGLNIFGRGTMSDAPPRQIGTHNA